MRGEKNAVNTSPRGTLGSPPHARGKVQNAGQSDGNPGITPACAGKRGCRTRSAPSVRDHPRMRGEKVDLSPVNPLNQGSPPHARGKDAEDDVGQIEIGITPACAGKRMPLIDQPAIEGDHPRMRGEKQNLRRQIKCMAGSPPHARGKAAMERLCQQRAGITPACAGKSPHE